MADLFDRLGLEGEADVVEAPTAVSSEKVWSAFQLAIFRNVEDGRGHTVIVARAGSGKTSTIVEAFRYIPRGCQTLMVAFNKSIAMELQARAPKGVDVSTLHSYGLRQVTRAFGRLRIEGNRMQSIASFLRGDSRETYDERRTLSEIVSLSKSMLANTYEAVDDVIDGFGVDVGENPKEREAYVRDALKALDLYKDVGGQGRPWNGCLDFDDMVWLPVSLALRTYQFDRLFIDEAQDLAPVQIELALRAAKLSGRICAVGDDRQSIYQFRGADARAIPNLIERLRAHVMPLSVTYRCARAIVREAQRIVPDIEPAPTAEEGEVLYGTEDMMKNLAGPGDFILSRANAPLVPLCLGFLRQNRRASIAGRDIGAQLASLVKKSQAKTVDELLLWIDSWKNREVARLQRKDADTQSVEDRAETIEALCEGTPSVAQVLQNIEALFADVDDSQRIVLSTAHKAKGLERDRVFMLAETYEKGPASVEKENLRYVAVSRARKTLWYIKGKKDSAAVAAPAEVQP